MIEKEICYLRILFETDGLPIEDIYKWPLDDLNGRLMATINSHLIAIMVIKLS